MIKHLLAVLLTILLATKHASAQNQPFEEDLYSCFKESFNDNGVAFEQYLKAFEMDFIKANKLPDNTPQSYLKLFKKMAENQDFKPQIPEKNLNDLFENLKPDEKKMAACEPTAAQNDVLEAKNLRMFYLFIDNDEKKTLYQEFAKNVLDNFQPHELAYNLYKFLILTEFNNIDEALKE